MVCSYVAVFINPQPPAKAFSELIIEDTAEHDVVITVAEGTDALDFWVHNKNYNTPRVIWLTL